MCQDPVINCNYNKCENDRTLSIGKLVWNAVSGNKIYSGRKGHSFDDPRLFNRRQLPERLAVRVTTLVQQPSLARLTNERLVVRVTTLIRQPSLARLMNELLPEPGLARQTRSPPSFDDPRMVVALIALFINRSTDER